MHLEQSPDEREARLSAYAFGELEGAELAAMEAEVAADPLLAKRAAELRAFGAELGAALQGEQAQAAGTGLGAHATPASPSRRGNVIPFPAWARAAVGFAAVAGVAVMVALHETAPVGRVEVKAKAGATAAPALGAVEDERLAVALEKTVSSVVRKEVPAAGSVTVTAAAPVPMEAPAAVPATVAVAAPVASAYGRFATAGELSVVRQSASADISFGSVSAVGGKVQSAVDTGDAQGLSWASRSRPAAPAVAGYAKFSGLRDESQRSVFGSSSVMTTVAAEPAGAEAYAQIREVGFVSVETTPLSTFSIDVDTASYANVRRFLHEGQQPPVDAVRVEELINYFPYRYEPPAAGGEAPFAARLAVGAAPWAPAHRLVRVAIKGREFATEARPPANLVFLVDVSGSMSSANKLPLVKASLHRLVGQLRGEDRVAIVTYAGASGLALPSTPASRSGEILESLDRLESGGSTNGGMGIHLAYDIAKANFRADGVNRVILCTDGDFNVGVTGRDELLSLIQEKARSRVFLTVLGFGMGNLKDGTLEMLADKGNGAYGYIDSEREARKIFVEQVQGTLATIAKDVKIQVEFNPARVASYRLIGYENRALAKEDFNNDQVDAGEVGAGHTITALYEVVPTGLAETETGARPEVDALKYGPTVGARAKPAADVRSESDELLTVKIRYKAPDADVSRKLEFPLKDGGATFAAMDTEFKFAAAVAAWGMRLRDSSFAGSVRYADVLGWAEDGLATDPEGHRAEFVELVKKSRALAGRE